MADPKRAIKRVERYHREWLIENGDNVFQKAQDELSEAINQSLKLTIGSLSTAMAGLVFFYGIRAIVKWLERSPDCSAEIHRAIQYQTHCIRLTRDYIIYEPIGYSLAVDISPIACLACYGVACGNRAVSREFLSLLREASVNSLLLENEYWEGRRFEPFVLHLLQNATAAADRPIRNWGVYSRILDHWNDESRLADALVEMCDYHCQHMNSKSGWNPEFFPAPFDLIAWEYLAIKKIRSEQGLTTPEISHPLLNLPFQDIDLSVRVHDEFLSRFNEYYKRVYGH